MNILEKEIEDILFEAIKKFPDALEQHGFSYGYDHEYFRQIEIGEYGRADIIGIEVYPKFKGERLISCHVIEIKKDHISADALFQALRYCRGIQRIVKKYLNKTRVEFWISLVGKSIDESDFVYCTDIFHNIDLYTYAIDFHKGVIFSKQYGYYLREEHLPKADKIKTYINKFIKMVPEEVEDLPF